MEKSQASCLFGPGTVQPPEPPPTWTEPGAATAKAFGAASWSPHVSGISVRKARDFEWFQRKTAENPGISEFPRESPWNCWWLDEFCLNFRWNSGIRYGFRVNLEMGGIQPMWDLDASLCYKFDEWHLPWPTCWSPLFRGSWLVITCFVLGMNQDPWPAPSFFFWPFCFPFPFLLLAGMPIGNPPPAITV